MESPAGIVHLYNMYMCDGHGEGISPHTHLHKHTLNQENSLPKNFLLTTDNEIKMYRKCFTATVINLLVFLASWLMKTIQHKNYCMYMQINGLKDFPNYNTIHIFFVIHTNR